MEQKCIGRENPKLVRALFLAIIFFLRGSIPSHVCTFFFFFALHIEVDDNVLRKQSCEQLC